MLDRVLDIISEQLSLDRDSVSAESKIIDDLGADSLDIVELIMVLEDETGAEIPEDVIVGFVTVGDVVNYLNSNQ